MLQPNEPMPATLLPIAPAAGARWRVIRRLVWIALAAALAVLGGKFLACRTHEQDCQTASRTGTDALAIIVCKEVYTRNGDPAAGALLADAYRRSGNRADASAIANGLLVTPARADAFRVLGKLAFDEHRLDDAMSALETARTLHRADARHAELAKDDQAIAGVLQTRYQLAQALRMLDECITEAHAADDRVIEGYCHVSAAHVLLTAGSFNGAQHEIDLASPAFTADREVAWLESQRGNLAQEIERSPMHEGYPRQAIGAFERALAAAERAQMPDLAASAELNLAFSLGEAHRPDDAEQHLAAATRLDRNNRYASERAQVAAQIAYRRGDLTLASSLNDQLYTTTTDDDDRLAVCATQAHIALASHDLDRAVQWARRGVEQAEKIRAAQSSVELRAWVLSSRREPYELLFAALARQGQVEQALDVFDQWQGRTLLDILSRPIPLAPLDLRSAANRLENLGTWIPAASAAPLVAPGAGRLATSALRSTDLWALVIADHDLWCITSGGGQLHIVDLGPIETIKPRLDRFTTTPTDRKIAEELGRLVLRDTTFRTTHETLRVVLDGPLSALPVAALRRNGQPLIASRPIVRLPRISAFACAPPPSQERRAIVLADAGGDLPEARDEAHEIAAMLGTTSEVGAEATSAALFAADHTNLLHVAVHADIDGNGGFLALYDQRTYALQISARKLAPALVVLSACDSALSNDRELAGSLASAFLVGGSTQVVATLRPISDAGAHELTSRFYRAGGVADPVHVLADIQASLADTDNTDWPSFAVFGHDLCTAQR